MLQLFFTIGGELQRNVISSLLQQVRLMQRIVLDLEGFRFYSSSLLIVFEGDLAEISEDEYEDDQVEDHGPSFYQKPPVVKIIDFANCTYPGFTKEDIIHEGPDSGFLFGLENLIEILNIIRQSEE
ncbi:inositol hexakisphosphate kinase 3 isoform X2 [Eurytemora carolleeae]|nr:inositol hexakisphosphate kinase 3 isoform X2 [Eurytemora carolleeae]|eukprot:XP_023340625.1 inositol hexakisphosphate kinase 3-like isoform X2 [Eurytemora affinis]